MTSLPVAEHLKDLQEEVDDVKVQIQRCKTIVINTELRFMPTPLSDHPLGVKDDEKREDQTHTAAVQEVH